MTRPITEGVNMRLGKGGIMRGDFAHNDRGQILVMFAVALPLLILFTAAAVDMGLIYVTKAKLSKAVDAACLTGVKNFAQGQTTANALATDIFDANFGANPPTPAFTWTAGSATTPVSLQVKATATVNTFFMRYLPSFATWTLSDTATATRSNLVMSLILDRSGSMGTGCSGCDGGGVALQTAVPNFVADFVNGTDHIAMISFAGGARVDVPLTANFAPSGGVGIPTAVANLHFNGGTFGTGAGTNPSYSTAYGPPLSMADNQNSTVSYVQETKVVVYFTDGLMNEIQDTLPCTNTLPGPTLYNFGGYDSASGNTYDFFDPILDTYPSDTYPTNDISYSYGGAYCTGGNGVDCNNYPPYNATHDCRLTSVTFYSQQYQTQKAFSRANITAEAQWRAIYTANAMRSETPVATYIYVIGLGSDVSGSVPTEAFLATLANDPNGPSNYTGAVYNNTLPAGLFLVVPDCPSSACTTELNTAFQTIAAKILLRLTQ
jgi:Flp pilus assembly protein TadG